MPVHPVDRWHQLVRDRDPNGLQDLLADSVVFHSPVVHTPQVGKDITTLYLGVALQVFINDSFQYIRDLRGERDAALEFQVEIEGTLVNGVDLLKWNEDGRLIEFKVMVRPLRAVNLIHQKMAQLLQARP